MQNNRRMTGRLDHLSRHLPRVLKGAVVLALLLFHFHAGRAATLTASVDRQTITLGERVTLSLTFDGVQVGQPNLPGIPNFQIVGQGSSLNMDVTRGVSRQTFTYQLAPNAPGDFTIPGLQFNAGGQLLRSQPIQVKVVRPGTAIATPGATAPVAFVKILTPKMQLYVGEVSEVEVQVYFQEGRLTQYPQLPLDPGLTAGKWLKPTETRLNLSNQVYSMVSFKQPVTPVKSGLVKIGPATVSLLVPDKNRRADFFFGRPETEQRMATEAVTLQVLPVPDQNVPATFAGAVGSFTLAFSATPTNLAAGDPITVRVKVAGRGALDAIRLPAQPSWQEFKTYPATATIETTDPNNNSGTKNFEQVVVPERAGLAALPSFAFSFFDPDLKAFRTLTAPAVPLSVGAPGGGASAMPSLPGSSNAAPAQAAPGLAELKPHLGTASSGTIWITQPWFLGLQLIPPALWLGLLAWRKYRDQAANNPRAARRAAVGQKIRQGLAELQQQAAAKNSDAFFSTIARLLQEQIGERIDAPASAITEAVVEERLCPAGAPDELCQAIHALFQSCNLARYAPVRSSEELSALIPKAETTLRQLQQWQPRKQ